MGPTKRTVQLLGFLDSIGAAPSAAEPEAHGYGDVERIADGAPDAFGPIAYVYPAVDLDQYQTEVPFDIRPILVAVVEVGSGAIPSNPMRLTAGATNCLYLKHDPLPPRKWTGYVTTEINGACQSPTETDKIPAAARKEPNAPNAAAYPPVTRFTEDNQGVTLVGAKCGGSWCEFGTNTALPSGNPSGGGVKDAVKGWHDEQVLAIASGTGLKRSKIRAIITPVASYDPKIWNNASSYGKWIPVARILVKANQQDLDATKYGHPASGPHWGLNTGENVLEMQFDGTTFTGQLRHGNSTDPIAITHRTDPGAFQTVARWRWRETDESGWIGCYDGCCVVDDMLIPTTESVGTHPKH